VDTITSERLKEISISNLHLNDSLMNAPASIGILLPKDFQRNSLTNIATSVNTIAGVFMQSGAYNTNRITIRGIGARTPFGTNKIRAFYGNIPLTSGDSETTIEDLNIENIGQAEIIKGPLSSLYGAGLGGAILLTPKLKENGATISATHGSFGLMKSNVSVGINSTSSEININYHKLESDGWRQNSSYDREGFTLAGELFRKENSKLTYLANYTSLKAFIPSSINKDTFDDSPQSAAPTWLASKGYEQYHSWLGGLGYEFKIGNIKNSTSLFLNTKDSNEPRPFDILKQNTAAYGLRTQFSGNYKFIKRTSGFIVGLEYFRDRFEGETFENLYQNNNGLGSLQGQKLSATEQERNFYNAFAQTRIPVSKRFEIQAGLNVNQTRFSLKNTFPNASSEDYRYKAIWSPQLSVLYKPDSLKTIYVSASRGFSLPSVEETLTATGTINSDIRPENGYNFEFGGKFYFLNRKLFAEIALYRMQIRDLLVARRVDDDQFVGVNAGKTLHQGIEAAANYNLNFNKSLSANAWASASIGNYKFEEFIDGDNDFSGNELTGVPQSKMNAGILITVRKNFYLSSDFEFVDAIPINDANLVYSDSYRIVNLKAGFRLDILTDISMNIAAGINNIFDEHYASMVLVNATAPPNALPRYYYPGLPVNYYGNISFTWRP